MAQISKEIHFEKGSCPEDLSALVNTLGEVYLQFGDAATTTPGWFVFTKEDWKVFTSFINSELKKHEKR